MGKKGIVGTVIDIFQEKVEPPKKEKMYKTEQTGDEN